MDVETTAPAAAAVAAEGEEPMEVDVLHAIETQLNAPDLDPEHRKKLNSAKELLQRFQLYKSGPPMRVGQLVRWKPGMSNRRMPRGDDVGIVSRVYDAPLYDVSKKDAGSPYFHEPLDVAVAILDSSDGEFIEFHYDSRRLKAVDDADVAPRVVAQLRELLSTLLSPSELHVGDSVRWKPGMKNKRRPKDNEPAVVAEVLPEPVFDDSKDAGGQYYREPLQVKVALLDDDGEFTIYHFDPRRLEVVPPGEEGRAPSRPSVTPVEQRQREPSREREHHAEPRPNPFSGLFAERRAAEGAGGFTRDAPFRQETFGGTAAPSAAAGSDSGIHFGGPTPFSFGSAQSAAASTGPHPPMPAHGETIPGTFSQEEAGEPSSAPRSTPGEAAASTGPHPPMPAHGETVPGTFSQEESGADDVPMPPPPPSFQQPGEGTGSHPPMPAQGETVPGTFSQDAPSEPAEGGFTQGTPSAPAEGAFTQGAFTQPSAAPTEGAFTQPSAPPAEGAFTQGAFTQPQGEFVPGSFSQPEPMEGVTRERRPSVGPADEPSAHPPVQPQGEFVAGSFSQGPPMTDEEREERDTPRPAEPQPQQPTEEHQDAPMTTAEAPMAATPGGDVD